MRFENLSVQGRPVIVLTGGPGGGKTTLLKELATDAAWADRFVALPEAISVAGALGISPSEKLFQRLMVNLEIAMEEGVNRALGAADPRVLLCHRGSLDPLAYWLDRGWAEEEFLSFTAMRREDHYARYTAVIHLVTAADGARHAYQRFPEAHRVETPEEAMRLDCLLEQVWSGHPSYFKIENTAGGWKAKSAQAQEILEWSFPTGCVVTDISTRIGH